MNGLLESFAFPCDQDTLLTNFDKSQYPVYQKSIRQYRRKTGNNILAIDLDAYAQNGDRIDRCNALHLTCTRSEAGDLSDFWRIVDENKKQTWIMTLNADEELNHVRSKIEIEQSRKEHEEARKAKAKSINAIFTHVAESREEAREERRNAQPVISTDELKKNYEKFKKDWKQLGLIIGVMLLLLIGTVMYFVEILNK